ncbi:unnamed protein product [Caenorhabditis bovis]|uniref:Glucosidase 2 subunit beta n=1 Tax=Caenorhabditis bovis TaxID=2654633 RepID=A0A8S1EY32_9PELO|nr:unnamed protein product [Caenorhabditis bovis]
MLHRLLLVAVIPFVFGTQQTELKEVRGVPRSQLPLFQPTGRELNHFTCLDGTRTILYSQLNDDYCDCLDGSDEPGTSACQNGQFFCRNEGHTGDFVPSDRVNDGICDCCDGSDEYNGGVSCANICEELGRAAKIERERIEAVARRGYAKRKELSREGLELRDEKLRNVEPLKQEKIALEPELKTLEEAKKAAEELERKLQDEHSKKWMETVEEKKKLKSAQLFMELDKNEDQKITLDELKMLKYLDTNNDAQVSDDEAMIYLPINEADYEYFHSNMYSRLNGQKITYDRDRDLEKDLEAEKNDDLIADEDRHDEEKEEEHNEDGGEDDEKMPPYPPETQAASEAAVEARKKFDELNDKVRDIDNKIREAEEFATADYGEDFAWVAVKGKCFERNVQQYTYTFCPFGNNEQKDTGAYGGTSLGRFKEWVTIGSNKYAKQMYTDGQQCWNGPKRSTEVVIECGEDHDLAEVTEPAKCEYHYVFRTPLACDDPDKASKHEEL